MVLRFFRLCAPALLCAAIALVLVASNHDATAAATDTGRPDQTVLGPNPAPGGAALRSIGNSYLSPVTQASRPFTHMMLRWDATMPASSTLSLEARASADGGNWTDWGAVAEDPDLWMAQDGDMIHWSQTIYAGEGVQFWQVRATLGAAPDGSMPTLRQLDVNTVDARFATEQPAAEPGATRNAAPAGLDKPPVVSRSGWGSPDGQSSRVRPVYYPVNHMVVHHTADANSLGGSERNWGDRVRAIWSFHTFTRGWGDVGYNYLIAPNGQIYEGRAGGDDVVAFHDAANYGSMGVSMIGTYEQGLPTVAAQESLVALLAWKANQKDIDPLGRSYYYGCAIASVCPAANAVVDNIAGHRQTRAGTECPGAALHSLLPAIRNRVKDQLVWGGGGNGQSQPDNGDLLVDEVESSFARSAANWYQGTCGYGGSTFYSYATDNQAESSNSATWRPNIPVTGRYRVYAHIPQGCGLAAPPYATTRAIYRIKAADRSADVAVDQNTADEWVDLGSYTFNAGSDGVVELYDVTGEPLSAQRIIFFDSIKWVPDTLADARVELINVAFDRTSVAVGEVLKVTFTIRNLGSVAISGQDPEASRSNQDNNFDLANSYVYDEGECFLGAEGQNYPAFPKQTDRFRVTLGPTNRTLPCVGNTGGYPWRWGLNGSLAPGEARGIIGYVRFREPGQVTLQAGVVQEYVRYHTQGAATTTINVTPERVAPVPGLYDAALRPMAQVYRLGAIPDNLLARTSNPLSIPRGEYIGSFAWDGNTQEWGEGGPFGLTDGFLIEQTRVFNAPVSGNYTFRTTSDDGSWLWVDGQQVVANYGLHEARAGTGTINLSAGPHLLSFKYFERTGAATAGYSVQMPSANSFVAPPDPLNRTVQLGSTFAASPDLVLVADDQGGSGVARLRYSWDGTTWFEEPVWGGSPALLRMGRLVDGAYRLRYQAIDNAGNTSAIQDVSFVVDTTLRINQIYMPLVGKAR